MSASSFQNENGLLAFLRYLFRSGCFKHLLLALGFLWLER